MKKQLLMILPLACLVLQLQAHTRTPNTTKANTTRFRASRPDAPKHTQPESFAQICCACRQVTVPDDCLAKLVVGRIPMPIDGTASGSGPGFSYVANTTTGTIVVTFDTLIFPVVTATAEDDLTPRTVQITDRTDSTVTLFINDFTTGETPAVHFHAIQMACPQEEEIDNQIG